MIAEFKVSGMHCPSCPKLIRMSAMEVDGVTKVDANEKSGIVKVTFDEKKAKTKEIAKKIEEGGYKISEVKERK